MCINDGTIGLFEVANKILKQSHLHFEPLVLVILLHHLQEGRSNLGNFLCTSKMQHRRGLARLGAKCSDGGVAPAFVIARGWKRAPPAVPYFAIAAHLNDCVYALMRESRETVLFE